MAQTEAERRRWDRNYRRRIRAEARAAGKPTLSAVNAAITEAAAFALTGVNIGLKEGMRASYVNSDQIMRVALKILCVRQGFNFEVSKKMIMSQLAPREEHRWPSHVPTWSHVLEGNSKSGKNGIATEDTSTSQ